ncbi:hypothetical protein P8X24_04030 [Pyrococcus kukulkanii]|uniref:hypothetical protein n=1 Tax=Pyrococcus kukulkanii TaxID=1609559 RepID=UPI003567D474
MSLSAYPFIKPADFLVLVVGIFAYYEFLKTGFEIFTYKRPRKLALLVVSGVSVFLLLFVHLLAAFAFTLLFVIIEGVNVKDSLIVALTAEFGFFMSFIALYFIFTTVGTMFGIEGLQLNLDWDELLHYAMGRS